MGSALTADALSGTPNHETQHRDVQEVLYTEANHNCFLRIAKLPLTRQQKYKFTKKERIKWRIKHEDTMIVEDRKD